MGRWVLAVLCVAMSGCASMVTTESLLDQMTNLDRLAEISSPAYVTRQFSSYEQQSKSPEDYKGWFANKDRGEYLRVEDRAGRQEYVMMDADGPGAIVRIWSANPEGTLRIYLDHSDTPVIEAPMKDLLGGAVAALPVPIAGERARGYNLYFPIPYAGHCKVTCDAGNFYYHVNYRTYAPGTAVRTFVADDLERLAGRIKAVADALASPGEAMTMPAGAKTETFDLTVDRHQTIKLADLVGPGAICEFRVRMKADQPTEAARNCVLEMTFDGAQTVACPLGDFFGTAPRMDAYASLPMGITEYGQMWSRWVMPFADAATVAVNNLGEEPIHLSGTVVSKPYRWTDESLWFHAGWRIQRKLDTRPFTDWTHLKCRGTGRFVGGALHIINPVSHWWGEGDEKIYVDGEKFPSHFGTGSEDYYGYAWCSNILFQHAYHNQTRCDGPQNFGNTSVNRFHIIDDIPFTSSFQFDMENWHSDSGTQTVRAAVSYWYARPGGSDFFAEIQPEDVKTDNMAAYRSLDERGAVEGEALPVLSTSGGEASIKNLTYAWSGEQQLWWTEAKPGDKLTVGFDGKGGGKKHLIVRLTKAHNYGVFRLSVNGKPVADNVDLYDKFDKPSQEMDLGELELKPGQNALTIEVVGANPEAVKHYMFGMDYLVVE